MTVADMTRMVALAAVYFGAAKLGLSFAFVAPQVTPVWPPTGIALAALVLFGPRLWPGVALGAFVANWTANEPALTAAGVATGNTLEALVGAALLRSLGLHPALDRLRDVVALIAAGALASPIVSATIGVTSLCAGGLHPWSSFVSLWWLWWIGDAMGAVVMAPLLLVWMSPRPARAPSPRYAGEGALVLTTLMVVALIAFTGLPGLGSSRYPLHYAALPLIVYAALRLGQRGATLATFITSAIAVFTTVRGWGPLATGTPTERVIVLLFFLAVIAATALLLTAAIMERDAAELRRAADFERLEENAQRLRLALEAGEMCVWDWDVESGVVRCSDNMARMFGLPPEKLPRRPNGLLKLAHPDEQARVADTIDQALAHGRYELEFRTARPDGAEQWMAAVGTVLRDAGGRPARMLGVGRDVTLRHRLEAELTRRAGELADADRRKDVFLAMLAHELRAPLAPISGALYLLRESQADRDQALAIAERQVKQMARLVDDLLDVSRITQGKIELCRESVALGDAVGRAVETTRGQMDAANQTLEIALPPEPTWIDADPARLAQILGNLLANAAKYTPPKGSIHLSAETRGADAVIRVRDDGPGIPEELLPRIFDLFVQGDTSLERARGGLGVGLTIVQQLVVLHGGRIEARRPASGTGSEFVVTLPRAAAPPSRAIVPPRPTDAPPRGKRSVLIVEDNRDTADSLARMLEVWGHRVRVTADGASALAVMDNGAADVVLSDLGLPGMDGYELARRIRRHPKGRDLLLIAVSGYGQAGDKARALAAGFDHHLVKPADLLRLAELLTAGSPGE
jgi:PAS domain S-box-containing protein